ncbi:hypothetical protein ANCDUO_23342 [Ancylostoma duodenale]|uniref:Uncharacterized protein n=1 Tax=Ancylostoma duodenale TaxID=51022 RepID=A0A0C2FIP7_9BILA|nr:hypothetical protein ANCDUO_23342 [Ancylostoma duodenale]
MNWAVMVVFTANSLVNPLLYLFFRVLFVFLFQQRHPKRRRDSVPRPAHGICDLRLRATIVERRPSLLTDSNES